MRFIFFDKNGKIYGGTHPEYYGYTFDSGEQMAFFKPMLSDYSLKLCQDITPNTAEGKFMQYAAVWMEDNSGIVQIGMNPERVYEVMEDNSLDNLVANLPFDFQGHFHVIDRESLTMIASTSSHNVGYQIDDGSGLKELVLDEKDGHITLNGKRYCVYTRGFQDMVLVRTYLSNYIYQEVLASTGMIALYILLITLIVSGLIIWYTGRKISNSIQMLVSEIQNVSLGNKGGIHLDTGISELNSLTQRINQLFENWDVDTTRLDEEVQRLKQESGRDVLTGLYNRRGFNERMEEIFKNPETIMHAAFVFLDADGLKMINDKYGHRFGDAYISEFGLLLEHLDEEHAVCGRLGGDEFGAFLYGYSTRKDLDLALEVIRQGRGKYCMDEYKASTIPLEFSMGCAYYPEEEINYHILMRIADDRMYQEKKIRKMKDLHEE